jgi:hypothetical protein
MKKKNVKKKKCEKESYIMYQIHLSNIIDNIFYKKLLNDRKYDMNTILYLLNNDKK